MEGRRKRNDFKQHVFVGLVSRPLAVRATVADFIVTNAVGATAAGLSVRAHGEMAPPAWSDVAVEASAAALSIAVLVAWCG